MPRGGRRPGSGAPRGNANAVSTGGTSGRAYLAFAAMCIHPNNRAIIRLCRRLGLSTSHMPTLTRRLIEEIYPAVFDPSHPAYNQINQKPEAGWPPPLILPELANVKRPKFKPQSKAYQDLTRLLALATQAIHEHRPRRPPVTQEKTKTIKQQSISSPEPPVPSPFAPELE